MNQYALIPFISVLLFVTVSRGMSHPADEQVTIVDIYFTQEHWHAEVRMNGESLFLNLPNDFPAQQEYEIIKNMYHNENISTPDLRPMLLHSFGTYIGFLFDEKLIECEKEYLDDPEYDYTPSMNESLWGMIKISGKIPTGAKTFRLRYPLQLYPLLINIHPADSKAQLSDIFPSGSTRPTQPYYFSNKASSSVKRKKHQTFLEQLKKLFE